MVGLVTDLASEMAEGVHVRADLADLRGKELVVPDGLAAAPMRTSRRAAGHAQGEDAAGGERNLRVVLVAEPDDLVPLHEGQSLPDLFGSKQVAVAALVVRPPAGRIPRGTQCGALPRIITLLCRHRG